MYHTDQHRAKPMSNGNYMSNYVIELQRRSKQHHQIVARDYPVYFTVQCTAQGQIKADNLDDCLLPSNSH